jgi:hypothetical protein
MTARRRVFIAVTVQAREIQVPHQPRRIVPAMHKTIRRTSIPLLISVVAVFAVLVPMASAAGGTSTTLKFITTNSKATYTDLGTPGPSPGDVLAYEGNVVLKGKTVGGVYGINTSVSIQGEVNIVSGQGTFELGGENSITVAGVSRLKVGATGLTVGEPTTRTIIGGTGKYAGARGTLVTTPQPNGTYRHVAHLLG